MMMIRLFVFLLLGSLVFASSSHGDHNHGNKAKKEAKDAKAYNAYHLTSKAKKEATAEYLDGCEDRLWKQDASKVKACPYCGEAMPDCGKLVKILPKRGVKYSMDDYDLPNKICPVSGEELEDRKHSVQVQGKTIYLCCKTCIKKFKKAISRGRADKYLKKLPLKPERFGFSKSENSHESHNAHNH
jgi:YHS domain-containing protein